MGRHPAHCLHCSVQPRQQEVLACLTFYHTLVPSSDIKVTNGDGEMLEVMKKQNRECKAALTWRKSRHVLRETGARKLCQADMGAEDGRSGTTSGSPVCQLPCQTKVHSVSWGMLLLCSYTGFHTKNKIIKPLLILGKYFFSKKALICRNRRMPSS